MVMKTEIGIRFISIRFAVVLMLIATLALDSGITIAQSITTSAAVSLLPDRVSNAVVLESEAITVRRITISPNSTEYHYHHPGGSIILLGEYSYTIPIPLSGELDAELRVGDVIRVPPGDYVLENPTVKPLDFLSIEVKH
jgi:mannose-6-phosphate isomerase-like protein (cupin superfamily)